MRVYRITSLSYADDPLSGIGAAITGARWNNKGVRMAYTAASRSLAILELLVHVGRQSVPLDRVMVPIDIPDDATEAIASLPSGWNALPYNAEVQAAGDRFVRDGRSLALRIPSAIVPEEFNVLVNPLHARRADVVVHPPGDLVWDVRLFG